MIKKSYLVLFGWFFKPELHEFILCCLVEELVSEKHFYVQLENGTRQIQFKVADHFRVYNSHDSYRLSIDDHLSRATREEGFICKKKGNHSFRVQMFTGKGFVFRRILQQDLVASNLQRLSIPYQLSSLIL